MNKYIKELLEQYAKVILPEFGAIVIEDEDTKSLMFNPYLSYDDGKLAKLVEERSSVDLQEAKNIVAKFIREIQYQVNKGDTYEIYELGAFSKNDDGAYIFNGSLLSKDVTTIAQDTSTSQTIASKHPKKEKTINKEENKTPTKTTLANNKIKKETDKKTAELALKEKKKKEKEAKKVQKILQKKKKKEEKYKAKVATKNKKKTEQSEKIENTYITPTTSTNAASKVSKSSSKEQKTDVVIKEEKKKRRPIFWILLILLIIVLLSLLWGFLNYNKVSKYMGWDSFNQPTKKEMVIAPKKEKQIQEKKPQKEQISKQEKKKKKTPVTSTNKQVESQNLNQMHFHIVAGCFLKYTNAKQYVENLKAAGYSDARIIGKLGALNEVALGSYASKEEAQKMLNQITVKYPGVWIDKR